MVDSEYSIHTYKSVKISIGTVTRNPEMLEFVPYHLKIKNLCKHAIRNQEMCNKAVDNYHHALESVPEYYASQKMCYKAVDTHPPTINYIPDFYKTQKICNKAVHIWFSYI